MADLNPNRAGNTLALEDGGGAIEFVDELSTLTVAQLGNVISGQLGNTLRPVVGTSGDIGIIDTALDNTDDLVARCLPTGSPLVNLSVKATAVLVEVAQAGAASTITLAASNVQADDFYNGYTIEIVSGTGDGQTRTITDYVNATNIATVGVAWDVVPDATSGYRLTGPSGTVWVVTEVSVSTNANKLRLTIVPPNGAWELVDGLLPTLNIDGSQLKFTAAAQSTRDFNPVLV